MLVSWAHPRTSVASFRDFSSRSPYSSCPPPKGNRSLLDVQFTTHPACFFIQGVTVYSLLRLSLSLCRSRPSRSTLSVPVKESTILPKQSSVPSPSPFHELSRHDVLRT
eukprot:9475299-Pyramimonas_sp.AAC.1